MASGTVSTTLSEWLVVILIVFSLVVEFFLHRIEHWIKTRHHHLGAVVRVLYRELMILGLVSFFFILYETIANPSDSVVLSFEFAHVFIFLLAVFYALVVLSTMLTSLRLSARWKRMEQIDLVNYLRLKDKYSRLRSRHDRRIDATWRLLLWWFPNVFTLTKYIHLHEIMAFHDIRFQFIYYRNLPDQFRFSSFLRKIKSVTFTDLVESHWSLYAIFLAVVLGDILRRHITGTGQTETDIVESVFIICAACLLAILVQILAMKIRRVYWQLTKHPRIYYESVEPAAVAEEIEAAEQRFEEQRAQRGPRSDDKDASANDTGNDADDEGLDAIRPSVDTPESEMLEPMRPKPFQTLRMTANPELEISASSPSGTMTQTEVALNNTAAPFNLAERPKRHIPGSVTSDDLRQTARMHALERHSIGDAASSSTSFSLQHRNSLGDRIYNKANPAELHSTAERHSLELNRRPGATNTIASSPYGRRGASIAIAAIEAARKRAAENNDPESGSVVMEAEQPRSPARRLHSPNIMSQLSSRRASTDDDTKASGSEMRRSSLDGRGGSRKRSIELAVSVPRGELAARLGGKIRSQEPETERDLEAGIVTDYERTNDETTDKSSGDATRNEHMGVNGHSSANATGADTGKVWGRGLMVPEVDLNADTRPKSKFPNATILNHLENQRVAQNAQPANYPWIVTKVIPRLGRVASPVEKLFWFGSHKFFLWCVEFVLFFSTVLLAASSAGLALLPLSKKPIRGLNIAALVLAAVNLLFVLLRIAGIIKKYIFILHNASLIPEIEAIEAIHTVSQKTALQKKMLDRDDLSNASGSETEMEEDESARERRRKLGRFFRTEAASGNVPGIDAGERRSSSDRPSRLRLRKRLALRRRRVRATTANDELKATQDEFEVRSSSGAYDT